MEHINIKAMKLIRLCRIFKVVNWLIRGLIVFVAILFCLYLLDETMFPVAVFPILRGFVVATINLSIIAWCMMQSINHHRDELLVLKRELQVLLTKEGN